MNNIIRKRLLAVCLGFFLATGGANYAIAEVDVGIHLSFFPQLVPVPGYPVYYAPQLEANFFFYEGEYWLYEDDGWYRSHWYDGPWDYVDPDFVPLFVLRVPVRYYRAPPPFFRGWYYSEPPRWGALLGPEMGNPSSRLGSLGSQSRTASSTTAFLSARILRRALSRSPAAARNPRAQLSVSTGSLGL